MGIRITIHAGVSPIPISVRLRVGGERECRGVCLVLKVGHAFHVTKHIFFIAGFKLCYFQVLTE